jgi:hypothetical protein
MNGPHNGSLPAFPQDDAAIREGLTKREYFAGRAMQGLLANPGRLSPDAADSISPAQMAEAMGRASLAFADALLAELAK